jgi:hypothetical protein
MAIQLDFAAATNFIWSNARLIDRYRFAHQFQEGDALPVLETLRAYQNGDGGFGNALEPDIRAPLSQPQPCELALHVLDELEAMNNPMVSRVCAYLQSITTRDGGVPFVLPMDDEFPRAPWWNTEPNPPAAVNPTAAIAGLLHKHAIAHPWLAPATEFCWREIEQERTWDGHDFLVLFTFLQFVPDRDRAQKAFQRLARQLLDGGVVSLDPAAEGYVFLPLQFAPTPDSPQRGLFDDETIERHLDALVGRQQPDGGWLIGFEPPSPAALLEWRGSVTVSALQTLLAYGRLPSVRPGSASRLSATPG